MKIAKSIKRSSYLVAFLLFTFLATAPMFAQQDPPGRVARLSFTQGTVSMQSSGATDWSQASLNYPLTTGDRIYTDQGGRAELEPGGVAIRLSENTDLTLSNLNDQLLQLGLGQGTIRVRVFSLPQGNSIEVDTPNGALTLVRPGDYRVETYPDDNTTLVSAYSGSLEINGGDLSQTLDGGQAVKLSGTDPIEAGSVSLPDPDDFDQWSVSRDRRYNSSPSARYVSRDIPGYNDLDEHGRWVESPEYGAVWYPNDVQQDWVPYRYGRWAWIEPWGWTWIEDEPWGYAPFHYGRWAQVDSRWGWIPGPVMARPVYAPALVAFVGGRNFSIGISIGGGGGGIQAWFPLGPREPYLPWYHHNDDYLRRVNPTNVRNFSNITNTQYINRNTATTAVPAATLQNGQPVPRQIVRISPQQMAQAQVIAHPSVAPTVQAAGGGRPAPPPSIRPSRVITSPSIGRGQPGQGNQGVRPGQPPVFNRTGPATPAEPAQPGRPSQPPITRVAPVGGRTEPGGGPTAQPRWITRTPPPPPNPPFEQKQPALQQHPGRPLEPQQVDNIRAGRPAGPMRDREIPAHPVAAPARQEKPAPPSRQAKPAKADKQPKQDKQSDH